MTIQCVIFDTYLRMLNIWFSDVKGFEDSSVQQTDIQKQRLVDVCLQARIFIPLYSLLSRSILCQLPGNAVGKRDPLQTISILFEQFLAVLLGLI